MKPIEISTSDFRLWQKINRKLMINNALNQCELLDIDTNLLDQEDIAVIVDRFAMEEDSYTPENYTWENVILNYVKEKNIQQSED